MADEIFRENITPIQNPSQPTTALAEMLQRTSWAAIWAGVAVAIGMEAMFIMFGLFIGFAIFSPGTPNPFAGVPTWTMVWFLVTEACSLFVGGWVAATLSDTTDRRIASLHGLATWGLTSFASVVFFGMTLASLVREATVLVLGGPANFVTLGITPADTSGFFLKVTGVWWGGLLLSLITAYFGALAGRPKVFATVFPRQQEPPVAGSTRLAA